MLLGDCRRIPTCTYIDTGAGSLPTVPFEQTISLLAEYLPIYDPDSIEPNLWAMRGFATVEYTTPHHHRAADESPQLLIDFVAI